MKKLLKKIVSAAVAVCTLSVGMVSTYAEVPNYTESEPESVCESIDSVSHTHVYGYTTQRVIASSPAGSHQHPIEYDGNGNVTKFAICYLRVDTYEISKVCAICSSVYETHRTNATIHSVT